MPPKLARGMDPLACLASDEDEEEEEEKEEDEEGERNGHAHAPLAGGVKAPAVVDYEALQRAGYRGCVCPQLSPPQPRAHPPARCLPLTRLLLLR
jgi:hypothetical protein